MRFTRRARRGRVRNTTAEAAAVVLESDAHVPQLKVQTSTAGDPPVWTVHMVVKGDTGNVGIGTVAPQARLHAAGTGHVNAVIESTDFQEHLTHVVGSDGSGLRFSDTNEFFIASQPFANRSDNTFGNEHLRIKANGNVGVGTTTPNARLDVRGHADTWGTTAFIPAAAKGPHVSHAHWAATGDWYIRSAASNGRVIIQDSGGNVGIGLSNPSRKLHVVGDRIRLGTTAKQIDLRTDGSAVDLHSLTHDLYIRTVGNPGKRNVLINPSGAEGNVGIGTTNPLSKLHVSGSMQLNGDMFVSVGVVWTTSDLAQKRRIEPIDRPLDCCSHCEASASSGASGRRRRRRTKGGSSDSSPRTSRRCFRSSSERRHRAARRSICLACRRSPLKRSASWRREAIGWKRNWRGCARSSGSRTRSRRPRGGGDHAGRRDANTRGVELMEGTLTIARLRADCRIAGEPSTVPPVGDRAARAVRDHLPQALRRGLAGWFDRDDESVWIIRRLDSGVLTAADAPPDEIAALLASSVGRALVGALAGDGDGVNVIRFAGRAAYLTQFVLDAAEGDPWSRWYYARFAGLKLLPRSAAIRTALTCDAVQGLAALESLDDRCLVRLTRALEPLDERAVVDAVVQVSPAPQDLPAPLDAACEAVVRAAHAGVPPGRPLFAVVRAAAPRTKQLVRAVDAVAEAIGTLQSGEHVHGAEWAVIVERVLRSRLPEIEASIPHAVTVLMRTAINGAELPSARMDPCEVSLPSRRHAESPNGTGGVELPVGSAAPRAVASCREHATSLTLWTRFGGIPLLLRDLDGLPWGDWTRGWPPLATYLRITSAGGWPLRRARGVSVRQRCWATPRFAPSWALPPMSHWRT